MHFKSIILLSFFALLFAGCSKSPESTVQSFYRAVENGEIAEAKKYLSSQMTAIGDVPISAVLSATTTKINSCGKIKSVSVKLSGEGVVRSASAIMAFNGKCPSSTDKIKLIQEDGNWKISFASDPIVPRGGAASLYDAFK